MKRLVIVARVAGLAGLAGLVFLACATDPAAPGTSDPPPATGRYLELRLALDGDQVTVVGRRLVESTTELEPSIVGDRALVGLAGGKAVYAQPFRFETQLRLEHAGTTEMIDVARPVTVLHVPLDPPPAPALDELAWVDATGQSHSLGPVLPPAPRLRPHASPDTRPLRYLDAVDLEPMLDEVLHMHIVQQLDISTLSADRMARIEGELAQCAPALRSSLTGAALVKFTDPEVYGAAYGSLMLIGIDRLDEADFAGTIIHEAAHAYTRALDGGVANFSTEIDPLVKQTIGSRMLKYKFTDLWIQIHESGADLGLTGAWVGDDWRATTDPLASGFVRAYGSSSPADDITTYVEGAVIGSKGGDSACKAIQAVGAALPARLAIPFAKLSLLHSAGFLTDAQRDACLGGSLATGDVGLFPRGADDTPQLSCTGSVKGGWVQQDGANFLVVLGNCGRLDMSVRVLAPGMRPPLGLHRLDGIWLGNLDQPNNAVYIADSAGSNARVSRGGLVLVTRVDAQRISGMIFMLQIGSALVPVTETFPVTTFRFDG